MEIKIKLHEGATMPECHGDWTDLATSEDVFLKSGEYRMISLGVSMEIPKGYHAIVAPRSSTYKKYGIMMANSIGVIDNDYNGDNDIWQFPARADRAMFIPKGTRICQFKLVKNMPPNKFVVVDNLENEDRGGFGSTGV